jgi:hypothetical protein
MAKHKSGRPEKPVDPKLDRSVKATGKDGRVDPEPPREEPKEGKHKRE